MAWSARISKEFAVALAVIVVLAALAVVMTLRGQLGKTDGSTHPEVTASITEPGPGKEPDSQIGTEVTTKSGLKYIDLKVGSGEQAKVGLTVSVNYTGWLKNGVKFDSSEGGPPLPFTIGQGRVIAGWEEGVQGMRVGGKRKLVIPPELAYGDEGFGDDIPPKAELTFEVELVSVRNPGKNP